MPIQSIAVDPSSDVYINFATGTSTFEIIFALADTANAYQRFALAQESSVFQQYPLSDFAYLDLRFGDKLYYKLKGS